MISEKLAQTGFRLFAICALIVFFVLSGIIMGEEKYFQAAMFFLAGLIILLLLIRSFNITNKYIAFFFHALRNDDTSVSFPSKIRNKGISAVFEGMNNLNDHFREIKVRSEYNENYYKTLIHHSASGLMVLDKDNKVLLINQTACRYANIPVESVNPDLVAIKNPDFFNAITRLMPGEDAVYKQIMGNEYYVLVFKASLLIQEDRTLKLISIQDIRSEMESRELESYRKLISVLTHEIMNLVTPLTSVSASLQSIYNQGNIGIVDISEDLFRTTQSGLKLINEHTVGLKQFIESYRKISKLPKPVIRPFNVDEWIDQIRIAFSSRFSENDIHFNVDKDVRINEISADKGLMNQVMINLLNNAVDALLGIFSNRQINLLFSYVPGLRVRIALSNNGPEIPAEIQDKIFVPFFTTKNTGSGIGLGICQEIVRLHRGSLTVLSPKGGETTFLIEI